MKPFDPNTELSADEIAGLAMLGQDFPTFVHEQLASWAHQAKQNRAAILQDHFEAADSPTQTRVAQDLNIDPALVSTLSVNGAQ